MSLNKISITNYFRTLCSKLLVANQKIFLWLIQFDTLICVNILTSIKIIFIGRVFNVIKYIFNNKLFSDSLFQTSYRQPENIFLIDSVCQISMVEQFYFNKSHFHWKKWILRFFASQFQLFMPVLIDQCKRRLKFI
jgi:hypothetical protein